MQIYRYEYDYPCIVMLFTYISSSPVEGSSKNTEHQPWFCILAHQTLSNIIIMDQNFWKGGQ